MGKYSNFPSQTPQMRPKSAIYTPKRDDEHPRHFYMESPPPPRAIRTEWSDLYFSCICYTIQSVQGSPIDLTWH